MCSPIRGQCEETTCNNSPVEMELDDVAINKIIYRLSPYKH